MKRLEQVAALVVAAGLAIVSYWLFFSWAGGSDRRRPHRPARPVSALPQPLGGGRASEAASGLDHPLLGGRVVEAGQVVAHLVAGHRQTE
ncbi:MAG: hypothetical protein VKJ05_06840 [Synechococcaceae cyanobacterium]|nr:hypothetical protein [Synechococcaceae cyanobacterium]